MPPTLNLPFPAENLYEANQKGARRELRSKFTGQLAKQVEKNAFLEEYLNAIPIKKIGVPDYYEQLSRKLRDLEERNLIYPINGGLFVHIYPITRASATGISPSSPTCRWI